MDKYEKILCDLYFNCRERWEEDNTVHVEDLEDFLYHAMLTDFHCELQDDSSMQASSGGVPLALLVDSTVMADVNSWTCRWPKPCTAYTMTAARAGWAQ